MKPFVDIVKFIVPFAVGIGILWWMYRGNDWSATYQMLTSMHWGWMLLSLAFGIVPPVFRALRWRLALRPLDEHPPLRVCTDAIFVSYAASLVVPRIGEVTRCGTLKTYAGTSFSQALGTVVSERVVDSVLLVLLTVGAALLQLPQYLHFLHTTGAALLAFCIGSFAVLVPTPNGAGPWHFAVKTVLVLYGLAEAPVVAFVLLVHTIQTALVVLTGAWGWADLLLIKKQSKTATL